MNRYIIGRRRDLDPSLLLSLMVYRYEIFVRRLGWTLPAYQSGLEQDEFDTADTVYLICTGKDGNIAGCGRLLPTTRPYLLQQHFAGLVEGSSPRSNCTWELSRFAAMPLDDPEGASSTLSSEVFLANLRAAAELGATQVVGVLSVGLERMCRRFGVPLARLGKPQTHAGQRIVGCVADVSGFVQHGGRKRSDLLSGRELASMSVLGSSFESSGLTVTPPLRGAESVLRLSTHAHRRSTDGVTRLETPVVAASLTRREHAAQT